MEPVTITIASLVLPVIQSKPFQDFLSRAGSRIASDAVRSRFNDKQGGGNLPALTEAQQRYLVAQNDREERGLELQQLHLALLHQRHQQDIALGLQKIQADHDIAHWSGLLSRDETVQLLTQAQTQHRLLLLLSEPDVSPSCPETFQHDLHREARAKVKQFLEQHYPLNNSLQPVEFFGKFFKSSVFDTQVKQLQNLLPGVPAVVLYSDLTDEMFYLHLYAWGLPEPLSGMVEWNWEEAKDKLEASGVAEKQALREIRKTIVALYQLCAALLADVYYLSVNPLHEPRVFHLSGSADTDTALAPYFAKLREFQQQVREAYEQDIRAGTKRADTSQDTPPSGPQPPPVENIHGWPADKVRDLQQRTATALGKPVVFRDSMKSGGVGPEMVVIPAGSFLMGSPIHEEGRSGDEGPQHQVTFAQPFTIGRYAVTFEEYERFRRADDKGGGLGRRPVINVSWEDAQAYCQWLSAETGQPYRLPSEAEWEYACRAGTTTRYHFGNTITQNQANFSDSIMGSIAGAFGIGQSRTKPVGQYPGNAFGLFDMHGNVWEWCADAWHGNYERAPQNGSAWLEGDDDRRAVRGGSWGNVPQFLRSGGRDWYDGADDDLGFRLARAF